jgi:hypothetical protein
MPQKKQGNCALARGGAARRKPRPTPGGNGGHCYRQMKDVVVNDKVHWGSLQRAKGLLQFADALGCEPAILS